MVGLVIVSVGANAVGMLMGGVAVVVVVSPSSSIMMAAFAVCSAAVGKGRQGERQQQNKGE